MRTRNLTRRRVLTVGIAGLIAAAGAAESASASGRRSRANVSNAAAPGMDVNRVVRGRVSFTFADGLTTIRASNRAIIDYDAFNIPAGSTVRFIQPSSKATVLNRIVGPDPSHIDGRLVGNGIVWIVNPAGVMFGPKSIVNVGGIYAAAGNVTDADFQRGLARFKDVQGDVINEGRISARSAAHLIGASVENSGSIVASRGVVTLTSGQDVFLSERGASLMVRVDTPTESGEVVERTDDVGVDNSGDVEARDIVFTSGDLYSIAIRHTGSARAEGGAVRMETSGALVSSGSIDVSDLRAGGVGGKVRLIGSTIEMQSGVVDASGDAGGGTVHIGGERHGRGGATATTTTVYSDVTIRADAVNHGDGGEVVVWADDLARYAGDISARGGLHSGDGGFVEVSGRERLVFRGDVDTAAPNGKVGNLLLDPKNITIGGGGTAPDGTNSDFNDDPTGNVTISANQLENLLDPNMGSVTNVTLQANNDILVSQTVNTVGGTNDPDGSLTLQAGRSIIVGANITTDGDITLSANDSAAISANRDAGAGQIKIGFQTANPANATNVTLSGANVMLQVGASGGSFTAGDITLGGGVGTTISADNFSAQGPLAVIIGGGSITSAGDLSITSGGNTSFSAAGRTLNAQNITLRAGDGTGSTAKVDFTNAPLLKGAGGGATLPDTVTIRQDAGFVASTDLLAIANFGDGSGITGLDYTLWSDGGAINIDNAGGAARVAKTNLTLVADGTLTVGSALDLSSLDGTGAVVDVNAQIEGTEGADSGVSLTSNGAITVGGALIGGANGVTLASGQTGNGNISFDAAGNVLSGGTVSLTAGNGSTSSLVDFTNAPSVEGLTNITSPGTYVHQQDAAIGAASILSGANFGGGLSGVDYTLSSLTGALTITNAANLNGVGSLTLNAADDVTVDVPITVINNFSSSGANFTNATGGSIAATSLTFNHTGNVTLENTAATTITNSTIGGLLNLDIMGDATVTATSGDLEFGASTITGGLTATATSGAISLGDTVTVTGNSSFTANGVASNADGITLGSDRLDSAGTIALNTTGNASVVRDGSGVTLAASSVGGNLVVTQTGTGSIDSSALVTVGGNATLSTGGGVNPFDISFSDLRATGSVSVTAPGSVSLAAGLGGINFGASSVGGNLAVTATNGAVTDSGTVTMNGAMSELTLSAGSVNLDALNISGSVGVITAGNATISNQKAITLLASTVLGNLSVSAGAGGVTDSGVVSVVGTAAFNADNGTGFVNLDQSGVGDAVSINTQGAADYTTASAVSFGTVSVGGDFTVSASDVNFVGGSNSVSAKNAGVDVFLLPSSAMSNIGVGAVTGGFDLSTTDLGALANGLSSITIGRADSAGALTIGSSTFRDPVTLRAPGAGSMVTVNGTVTGSATGTSITIQGAAGDSIDIGGTVQTNSGAITINHDLNLTGSTTLSTVFSGGTGANITTMDVDSAGAVGSFTANAGTGALSLMDAGAGGMISTISLTGGASVTGGDATAGVVTISSNGAVSGDALSATTGLLSVTGGSVAVNSLAGTTGVTLEADSLTIANSLSTTGAVTVRQHTASRNMGVGVSVGGLDLTGTTATAIYGLAGSGYSSLTLGRADGTGTVTVGSAGTPVSFFDPTTILAGGVGGGIAVNGGITMDAASSLQLNSTLTTLSANLTGAGSNITLVGPATVAASSTVSTPGGAISVGTMNATGASNLTLSTGVAGSVTLNGNLGSTGAFGQLNVTSPATLLASNVNVNANGADFSGSINSSGGARAFNVTVGAGGAEFAGQIGTGSALSSMSVTGSTDVLGTAVTTSGDQTWGDVDVTSSTALTSTAGSVRFNGDLVAPGAVTVSGPAVVTNGSVQSTGSTVTLNNGLTVNTGDTLIASSLGSTINGAVGGGGDLTVNGALAYNGSSISVGSLDLNGALTFSSNNLNITTIETAEFAAITGPGASAVLTVDANDGTTGATFGGNVSNIGTFHSTSNKNTIAATSISADVIDFDNDVDLAASTTLTPGAMPAHGVFFGGDVLPSANNLTLTVDGRAVAQTTGGGIQEIEAGTLQFLGTLEVQGAGGLDLLAATVISLDTVAGSGSPDLRLFTPSANLNGNISGVDGLEFNPFTAGADALVVSSGSSISADSIDFNTRYRSDTPMTFNSNAVSFEKNASGLGGLTINADTTIEGAGVTFDFSNIVFNGQIDAGSAGVTDVTISGGTATFTDDVGQSGAFDNLRVLSSLSLDANAVTMDATTVDLRVMNSDIGHSTDLTINADALTLGATVGGALPLGSIVANIDGTSTIMAPVTTTGGQSYFSPVVLTGDSTITATNAIFGGTINGAFNLVVDSNTVSFGGAIGQSTALASFDSSGATTLADPRVRTTGAQSYGDLLLGDDAVFAGLSVAFNGTVGTTNAAELRDLTVDSGAGDTIFADDVTGIRDLRTDAEGTTRIGGDMEVWGVRFDDAVVLTDDVMISAAGDEGIFFNDSVDGAHSLTLVTDRDVLTPIFNAIAGGDGKLDAAELEQFRLAILNRLLNQERPLPVISFGGDVGSNVALTQLLLNPDTPSALNPSGMREIPAVWATVVGGSRGGDGQLTLDPDFVLNMNVGEFTMGANEKFTVLGSLNINATTKATIGDLTVAKDLTINSPMIALQARDIGYLIAPLEQKKQQKENDLGILDGYSNNVTDRVDIVAGGSINFSVAPTDPDAAGRPVGQPIKAFIAGKQYNQVNNNPNTIGLEFLQLNDGFPISDLVLLFNTNNRSSLGDVPGFEPLLVGGSTIQLVLDIPHSGLIVANPPITPVVIVNTGVGIVEDQVLVSQSVRERLERIGVSARDASAEELAEASTGRTLYNDYADDTLASDSIGQYSGEIVVNRLPARVAQQIVDEFDALVGPNDERLNAFLDSLAAAYLAYQDEAPEELFDDPRLLATGFAAKLHEEQAGSELEIMIQRIAMLLNDIERLGVTRFEYERSLQAVLSTFTPDPDMSLEEFRTVVEWYRDQLAAPPADVVTPQEAIDTTEMDGAASES